MKRVSPSNRSSSWAAPLDRRDRFGPHVGEQVVGDAPVLALHPAADDLPVHPDRRPAVAVAIEQPPGVRRVEVPVAPLPAHRGRIEPREQRHPWLVADDRIDIARGDPARCAVEIDLRCGGAHQRPPRGPERPARPPLHVGRRRRPEGPQPQVHQFARRSVRVGPVDAAGHPRRHRRPAILTVDPRPDRSGAHDGSRETEQEQHPRVRRLRSGIGLADRHLDRDLQRGDCVTQVPRRGRP